MVNHIEFTLHKTDQGLSKTNNPWVKFIIN